MPDGGLPANLTFAHVIVNAAGGDLPSEWWIRDCNRGAPVDALPGWDVEDSNLSPLARHGELAERRCPRCARGPGMAPSKADT